MSIAARLRQLADEVAALEGVALPPTHPPPAPSALPTIHTQPINRERLVCLDGYFAGNKYERHQHLQVWRGASVTTKLHRRNVAWDIVPAKPAFLPARTYTVLADGVAAGSAVFAEGQGDASVTVDLVGAPEGWIELTLDGLADGETCPTWFAYRWVDGTHRPEVMPVCTQTYDLTWMREAAEHAWAWVPTTYTPKPAPLPARSFTPFSDAPALTSQMLTTGDDKWQRYTPNVNRDGIVSSFNVQNYFWEHVGLRLPMVPLLDGPRGVGMAPFITHLEAGRAAPPSMGPVYNVYFCDPWRVGKIRNDGTIVTLAGWRHRGMHSYHEDADERYRKKPAPATLELVGDWSAIPVERHGFWELWGMAWDSDSLVTDESAEPIASEKNLKPHLGAGPVMFVSDTLRNRICKIQFSGVAHGVPPVVTEFITGMSDPWDVVEHKGTLLVSERTAHKITQWDIKTGAYLRTVVERSPALIGNAALLAWQRTMSTYTGTLADRRAQPCLSPEGLYVIEDWLYYGALATQQIKRINLLSGVIEHVCDVEMSLARAMFVKFAVSDGTCGPKGTVFFCTWDAQPSAGGEAILPGGATWNYSKAAPWTYNGGYATAVAARDGRIYFSATGAGVARLVPGAPVDTTLYNEGAKQYHAEHLNLIHGPHGFSHHGYLAPFGKSAAIDYYLTANEVA